MYKIRISPFRCSIQALRGFRTGRDPSPAIYSVATAAALQEEAEKRFKAVAEARMREG